MRSVTLLEPVKMIFVGIFIGVIVTHFIMPLLK